MPAFPDAVGLRALRLVPGALLPRQLSQGLLSLQPEALLPRG